MSDTRLSRWLRSYRVLGLLERLGWCWADLVSWGLRWHRFDGVTRQSKRCAIAPTGCYCGKYGRGGDA